MPDPVRSSLFGTPGYVWLLAAAVVVFGVFIWRGWRVISVIRRGRPEPRWDQLPRRVWNVVVNVAGQRRMLNDRGIGLAHFFIFWTFVFYATSFGWNLVRGLIPALPIPYSDEVAWFALPMEILTFIAVVALVGAALRRYVFTPDRLSRTWDATLILILISVLLITFLIGQGAKAVAEEVAWSPAGDLFGSLLSGLGVNDGAALYQWMWWLHMATVLGFMGYLPFSKHLHLLASPFSVFTVSLQPGGIPPGIDGAATMEEFTWRELYSAVACAECGRCDRVCPAFASGLPLSPKDLIHEFREVVLEAADGGGSNGRLLDERIAPETIWACATCMACMERCPVFNEHIPLIIEMRRHLVGRGDVEGGVQDTLMNLVRYGNSFGKSPRHRPRWTRELDFGVKDARKEPVDYLWFVGDYASFDPRVVGVTRGMARVLDGAGIDFGILFEGEQNAGNDVRRIGEEGLFEMLRDKNLEAMGAAGFDAVVTTDPHTYHALKYEYETNGHPVLHYTELLDEMLADGRLSPAVSQPAGKVTYHDPCYLGRYGRVFEPPRRVISRLGFDLVEMPRNRATAMCCGAGGGRIWMEDGPDTGERPAEMRVREAASLEGVDTLVVACPKDLVMFQDALKTTGLEDRLVVRDIAELVEEASRPMARSATS